MHEDLLSAVKKHKLRCFGHISRASDIAKRILEGRGKEIRRRKRWEDNIKDWTGLEFGESVMYRQVVRAEQSMM